MAGTTPVAIWFHDRPDYYFQFDPRVFDMLMLPEFDVVHVTPAESSPDQGGDELVRLIMGHLGGACRYGSNSGREVSDRRVPQILLIDNGISEGPVQYVEHPAEGHGVRVLRGNLGSFGEPRQLHSWLMEQTGRGE
ncbi:hypothetical protein N658DRAFT_493607 [Parathielavia hyrcaniae]|uniref:Uncharacterized protein n=1 Tax=Parathielavia hyrcaniae TaxID=113614 RepID=A0AAN6Q9C6_9PEZI|nr:hypothetical protein N658DRAFT_493607 [Parathielavia hyrcaniae]